VAKFVYIYTGGGSSASEEDGQKLREAWVSFFRGLGESIIDSGNQFGAAKTVNGNSTSNASGYTVVDAATIEEAIEKARPCPIIRQGGDVEVYEALEP
jgi:hypothetical protein